MINKFYTKFSNINYFEEKKRFLLFSFFLLLFLYLAFKLFGVAYASYETNAKLNASIDRAIYLIDNEGMSFNIDPEQIIPSNDPYVYKFSISNFNAVTRSDIDVLYELRVTTTTNLPLTFELYRNENYDDVGAINLFSSPRVVQDEDGAWYNIYEPNGVYEMAVNALSITNANIVVVSSANLQSNSMPTGLCYIAIGDKNEIHVYKNIFKGNHFEMIDSITTASYFYLIKKLRKNDFHFEQTTV